MAVAEAAAPPATRAAGSQVEGVPASALGVITKNIPTEVIGAYLAVLAIIPTERSHFAQWAVFWCFWVITPVIVWVGVGLKQGYLDLLPSRWPRWHMIAAALAFIAWAAVIPNSAISYLPWFQPYMGALAIILLSVLLPLGETVSKLQVRIRPPGR